MAQDDLGRFKPGYSLCWGILRPITPVQKGKTSLDLNEARDDGVLGCCGINWTISKQSAPRSRQMTTQTPHHSIFTGRMFFPTPNQQCQSTEGTFMNS